MIRRTISFFKVRYAIFAQKSHDLNKRNKQLHTAAEG